MLATTSGSTDPASDPSFDSTIAPCAGEPSGMRTMPVSVTSMPSPCLEARAGSSAKATPGARPHERINETNDTTLRGALICGFSGNVGTASNGNRDETAHASRPKQDTYPVGRLPSWRASIGTSPILNDLT